MPFNLYNRAFLLFVSKDRCIILSKDMCIIWYIDPKTNTGEQMMERNSNILELKESPVYRYPRQELPG